MHLTKIEESSYVLLFHTPRKKWLTKAVLDKKFHTHLGIIDISSIIGMEYGSAIRTTEGKLIFLMEPTIHDFIMKSERKTQIVYPKDLGYIAARTGLKNGSKVLEIGTGSGALATFMASIVKPEGHIYSFDVNSEFMEIAKRNLEKAGMDKYVTIQQHDPHQGIDVRSADVATVDLGDPWTVVDQVYDALKGGGAFVAICPTMNQIEKTAAQLKKSGYADIDCVELMIREIEAREGMTRPSMRMIGHTAYLVFARKVEKLQERIYQPAGEEGEEEKEEIENKEVSE
ncbi:MAG: tRNA (adenine-N1)-methyltransferase [Thermoproteota archaeon]|nr:tRNA (adenine-N1)-methyltransferase [Thermoproteota archaeon]